MALAARGLTQRQIATQLGVAHRTISNWLGNFGTVPELPNTPVLPDAAALDDIARILKLIFEDHEWRAIPLREIARHTRIPFATVHFHYKRLSDQVDQIAEPKPKKRRVKRGKQTYTMDTAAIGQAETAMQISHRSHEHSTNTPLLGDLFR